MLDVLVCSVCVQHNAILLVMHNALTMFCYGFFSSIFHFSFY
ncbi:hypothetical protein CAXC1_180023 [Candidatus Xenohaliotis californiensis]|uniref:Uncharacterized protein n=1 Tax=Candidatus Xenohaliotis californiensis TaxID=84677 RepID=A0ABM9N7H0_9RICK|nr:hypothetical protein CAXC1_180023 [Candidatus Xenohaliotis californiensis]